MQGTALHCAWTKECEMERGRKKDELPTMLDGNVVSSPVMVHSCSRMVQPDEKIGGRINTKCDAILFLLYARSWYRFARSRLLVAAGVRRRGNTRMLDWAPFWSENVFSANTIGAYIPSPPTTQTQAPPFPQTLEASIFQCKMVGPVPNLEKCGTDAFLA